MNQKTKPSIESHMVGDQNDIWVVGLCRFALEEFDDNDNSFLYYGKISVALPVVQEVLYPEVEFFLLLSQ